MSEIGARAGATGGAAVAAFLGEKGPFSALDAARLEKLAARIVPLAAGAGAEIVRQGEPGGEVCYLLRSGSAEVATRQEEDGAPERRLATLAPGDLFGEAPLLTESPHHAATVRALEPCEVLAIRREDLLEAMGADGEVADCIHELLRMRHLPRQAPGVVAHRSTAPDGGSIVTLKDPARGTYFRLSEGGLFLWERLDGRHTLQDLMLEYFEGFGSFEPGAVSELVERLTQAGFAEGVQLSDEARATVRRPTGWRKAAARARKILEWRAVVGGADRPITRLYEGGVRLLYTWPAQVVLAAVALAGLVAFVLGIGGFGSALAESGAGGWLLLFWVPATVAALLVHEAGHAFTTKHYGREVPSVGVGWYWFGPIAYVDTSDMWLEGRRWPRIAVSLAGPYADTVTGGMAAIGAFFAPDPVLAALLWQFALVSYVEVLINFNPLMEFDGYYVLIDLLERPNLRPDALLWLGTGLLPALREPSGLRGHRLELVYGLASVLYVALMGVLTVVLYRLLVQDWLASVAPEAVASGAAWVLAGAVVVLASAGVLGELRGGRTYATTSR